MRFFIISLAFIACSLSLLACAHQKKIAAKKHDIQILQASVQRTLPGRREAAIMRQYTIVLKWLQTQTPQTFFFCYQNTFWICDIQRAHYNESAKQYITEEISFDKIKPGDTLQLTTTKQTDPPASLNQFQKNNSLIYKLENANWNDVEINNIVQRPDIFMP